MGGIDEMYEKQTYLDQYGNSVVGAIVMLIMLLVATTYLRVLVNLDAVKADWAAQRCSPGILPIAGFVRRNATQTVAEATAENFTYCVQGIQKAIAGDLLQPLTYATGNVAAVFKNVEQGLNDARTSMASTRNLSAGVTTDVMGKLLNTTVPLQQVVVAFKDMVGKTVGTLTTTLYAFFGTYLTLKSSMGAFANIILKILLILVATIVPMLMTPFSAPFAVPLIAVFASISVPLAVILVTLGQTMGIHPNNPIPKVPKPPRLCFDADTPIGSKRIADVHVGDDLGKNGIVTAVLELDASEQQMFCLDGVVVSGGHNVRLDDGQWVHVADHPAATKVQGYDRSRIFCINTSSKRIYIGGHVFCDWDDICDDTMTTWPWPNPGLDPGTILCGTFQENSSPFSRYSALKDVCVGDVLVDPRIGSLRRENHVVLGVVRSGAQSLHLITDTGVVPLLRKDIGDYSAAVDQRLAAYERVVMI